MSADPNLNAWLTYIAQLHPKAMDLTLERVQIVAKKLDLLHFDYSVITVAGTNGKGSCVTVLESILTAAGYRVGAYFSPHLECYNERVRIAGNFATDEQLCQVFSAIEHARQNISLTYFEWTTLAALVLFKQNQLDVIILEVGLGGRLDAVNIVEPDVSVITTIDLDHTEWLGVDREMIGKEKAGIFRPGIPAVCGDLNPPESIYEMASRLNTPLYCQNVDFGYIPIPLQDAKLSNGSCRWKAPYAPNRSHKGLSSATRSAFRSRILRPERYSAHGKNWQFWCHSGTSELLPTPSLLLQNAAAALMALELLNNKLPVSTQAISTGLKQAFLPGRFQILSKNPLIVLDVAHNPQSCRQLRQQLITMPVKGKTHAILGMLSDKDHQQSLKPLLPCIDQWYVAPVDNERSTSSARLAEILSAMQAAAIYQFESITTAYEAALNQVEIQDRIVIFGSFYAVSPILRFVKNN